MKKMTLLAMMLMFVLTNVFAFTHDGLIYEVNEDQTSVTLVKGTDAQGALVIPETVTDSEGNSYTVTAIAKQAFSYAAITSVEIPSTVKKIDRVAFSFSKLQRVKLAEGLEVIGYSAFSNCTELTSVEVPNSVIVLGELSTLAGVAGGVFYHCTALESVKLPAALTVIEQAMFKECESLKSIEIPSTVTKIDNYAFEGCVSLESITMPDAVTELGESVFGGCLKLSYIHISKGLDVIPFSTFTWCESLKQVEIPNTIVEIGKQAFADCYSLEKINVPNSVEHIVTDAFQGCSNVSVITLGSGVKRIGCTSLAVWAVNEQNIAEWSLTEIHCRSLVPPVFFHEVVLHEPIEDFFFATTKDVPIERQAEFYESVTLYVPKGAAEAYRSSKQWGMFVNIVEEDVSGIEQTPVQTLLVENNTVKAEGGIAVYTMNGVKQMETSCNELNIEQLERGVYLIKAGTTVQKIYKK